MPNDPFILLHRERGFNPMALTCRICGKDKDEIAPPMNATEPCDACKENYLKVGTAIFETEDESNCLTGICLVITDDVYRRAIRQEPPVHKVVLMRRLDLRKNFQYLLPKERRQ